MVLAGQYLERPTLIVRVPAGPESTGLTLEGLYHRGMRAPAVLICAPHPRMGGSMDSAVVAELAWALTRRGHATLRFNYQGVGASEGVVQVSPASVSPSEPLPLSSLSSEVGDAAAAAKHLAECVEHGRVAVIGYSFGAAVAVELARTHREISHVLLVAPPTQLFDFTVLSTLEVPLLVAAGHQDPFVNRALVSELLAGREQARFEVLAGSDHTFTRGLTDLGVVCGSWLDQRA